MANTTPTPSPAEQLEKDIRDVRWDIENFQKYVNLATLQDQIEDLQTKIRGLSQRVINLRSVNYVFDKTLDGNVDDLIKKWQPINMNLKLKINQESQRLKNELRPIETQIAQIVGSKQNIRLANQLLSTLKVNVDNLEDKIRATESTIRGLYNTFEQDFNKFNQHLTNLETSFKELGEASFNLLAHECLIMAVEATWTKDGREDKTDPKGNLFLTDQRLIFEQKEEVATKKVLFITTERKMVQELLFEIPIRYVEEVKATELGVFKNKDFLDILFSTKATYQQVQVHLHGHDCGEWKAMINKVLCGDYDKDRIKEIESEVIEKIKNAPTICPNCNASIVHPVLRGMDHITCDYCGSTIKL
ncbi:MAG: hypothetical protein CVU39_01795 [Chloroflexi bacterium HGW-Chloroflexi-10]|nr:MAG: hypothetical protein CVU39_01795 [Chloroflexi bacterium HGW-Chloroflexi-10]